MANFVSLFLLSVLALAQRSRGSLFSVNDDFCIDRAFQRWHLSLAGAFGQYSEFTSYASSSRSLFPVLFTQDFTSDSFAAYCKVHEDARKVYEACPDSEAKDMANIEFALIDHVCIKRVQIYSQQMPCLEKNNADAISQCRNACRTYESNAHRYTNPSSDDLNNDKMNWIPYMASDCQYLKCMTLCKKPIFQRKCSSTDAADLEYEALRATYAKKINYYDPPFMRNLMRDSFVASMIYPVECQELVDDSMN